MGHKSASGEPGGEFSDDTGGGLQGNPRDIGQDSDRNRSRSRLGGGGRMRLPAEFADFILADGRRLEDVLGKSFFDGSGRFGPLGLFGKGGKKSEPSARERVLAERRAQARRLNQNRAILTGAQGAAGAANIDKSELSGG